MLEQREKLWKRLRQSVEEANKLAIPKVDRPSFAIGMSVHIAGNNDAIENLTVIIN